MRSTDFLIAYIPQLLKRKDYYFLCHYENHEQWWQSHNALHYCDLSMKKVILNGIFSKICSRSHSFVPLSKQSAAKLLKMLNEEFHSLTLASRAGRKSFGDCLSLSRYLGFRDFQSQFCWKKGPSKTLRPWGHRYYLGYFRSWNLHLLAFLARVFFW